MVVILDIGTTILAILNLHYSPMPPIKFKLNQTYCLGQDGGHLGYQNRIILAILNLHVSPMPSTKFQLHPTYGSRADNNWRLSRWPPWRPSWKCWKCEMLPTDIRMADGSWTTDHGTSWPGAKAPGELTIEGLQDGCCGRHRGYCNKMVLAIIWISMLPQCSFQVSAQSDLPFGNRWGLKILKMAILAASLDIGTDWF